MTENNGVGPKYSLAMIVRNCAEKLDRCLRSFAQYPDEIVIVNTATDASEEGFAETTEVASKYGARVEFLPWPGDFSKARQFSFDKCSNEYVLWLDSDDVVAFPERFDRNLRRSIHDGTDVVLAYYNYEFNKHGLCTTRLVRERLVRRSLFEWRAPLHEVLCAKTRVLASRIPEAGGHIIHDAVQGDHETTKRKLDRNLEILERNHKGQTPEPRMLFYWGNTLIGLNQFEECLQKFDEYLDAEPNPNALHVYTAHVACAEALRKMRRFEDSFAEGMCAVESQPSWPSGWLQCAEALALMGRYDQAIRYADVIEANAKNSEMEMVCNPTAINGRPAYIRAWCHSRLGRLNQAAEEARKALNAYPEDEDMLAILEVVEEKRQKQNIKSAFALLRDEYVKEGAEDRLREFASMVPSSLRHTFEVNRFLPKDRPEGQRSIAFVSPGGYREGWGPESLGKGVGGSEEAVINMATLFARRGWHVEVYCYRADYVYVDGVHWYPETSWSGDTDNPLDVAIWWRGPGAIRALGSNAKLNYLWLHDMPIPEAWEPGIWDEYDRIFVLSDYHKKQHSFIPEEKLFVTRNGLNPDLFAELGAKEPSRWIWGSDPQRGLLHILRRWERVKEAVPDAEIHVFYGWSPNYLEDMATHPHLRKIYEEVERLKAQPGVFWHGRVGQKELAEEYSKAGLWVYPTEFPEISCITAMWAQAHGAIPVCTDDFALSETVRYGYKCNGPMGLDANVDALIDRAIWVSQNYAEAQEQSQALQMVQYGRSLGWNKVADQWEELITGALPEAQIRVRESRLALTPSP